MKLLHFMLAVLATIIGVIALFVSVAMMGSGKLEFLGKTITVSDFFSINVEPLAINFVIILLTLLIALGTIVILIFITHEKVIAFFDGRMLPEPKDEELITIEDKTDGEYYETELNEQFEGIWSPDWWAVTFKETVTFLLVTLLIALIASAVIYAVSNNTFAPANQLLSFLIDILILSTVAIKYFFVEWPRQNTLYIFFTGRLIRLRAFGSLIGFLIGRAADIERSDTPLHLIKEPITRTDPRRFKNEKRPNDILDAYYDFLGGRIGLRSVLIPSIAENAEDYFLFIKYGNSFVRILNKLKKVARKNYEELEEINRVANGILVGTPEEEYDREKQSKMSEKFFAERTKHMSPRKVVNLFALKKAQGRWDKKTGEALEA